MNTQQKCDKCLAHNISANHTCDSLMRALKENYDKKHGHTEQKGWTADHYELSRAILGALEHRGFYDCGKYLDHTLLERIEPLLNRRLAAYREELVIMIEEKTLHNFYDTLGEAEAYSMGWHDFRDNIVNLIKDTKI